MSRGLGDVYKRQVLCDLYLHDFNCALEQFEDYLEQVPGDKEVAIWVADVKQRVGK